MHPLDVIKTRSHDGHMCSSCVYSQPISLDRFQIQRGPDDPGRYKSYADCVKKMARNEG